MRIVVLKVLLALMAASAILSAESPLFWEQSSFSDFQRGQVTGCSVAQDGRIVLAPEVKAIYSTDQVLIWTMVADSRGNIFLGTGHGGKVFKIDAQNQGKLFYTAKELDVFALAVDSRDNLYVGTSPNGKVFKVAPDGSATEFFDPHAKYIWSMVFDPQGNLYVGTGDQGKIYKVDPAGKGSIFFETKQTHVMALKVDTGGNLLAGTFPEGILYRVSPLGKGFVLYDSPLQEIHTIDLGPDGSIYIGCLNEKIQRRFAPLGTPQGIPTAGETPSASAVTVTVTEAGSTTAAAHTEPVVGQTPFVGVLPGMIRSAIYRIAPDLSVETLWSSREEDVFDLLVQKSQLVFATDIKGHIYDLPPDHNYSLLAQTNEAQVSRLLQRGHTVFVATSNVGKLYEMVSDASMKGTVESVVKDTQLVSKWGIISWHGNAPAGSSLQFFTRSGNSELPDSTWSDWSAAYTHAEGEQISSPPARFIQWKAELAGSAKISPWIDSISVAYLPQNIRPEITALKITPQGLASAQPESLEPSASSSDDGDTKGISSGAESAATVTVTAFPTTPAPSRNRITIRWQAEDKNHDTLEYALYIRGVQETAWRLLKKEIRGDRYVLDPETLPDGLYRVRLVVDDSLSNPPQVALSSEKESEPFLVDNTPPQVEVTENRVEGNSAVVRFRATDSESHLRRAEMSVDSGKWQMIESDDGIVDSTFEEFTVREENLPLGEHVVSLRVFDASGNPGLARAVFQAVKK